MSRYKTLDEPITRREACTIIDRRRFDALVRAGELRPLGKLTESGPADADEAARTAPLVFDQQAVRDAAKSTALILDAEAKEFRAEAKKLGKRTEPMTKRQVAAIIGKRLTGILIRGGKLVPSGRLTDTQTAAHTYDPTLVAAILLALAEEHAAEAKLLRDSSKVRVPA